MFKPSVVFRLITKNALTVVVELVYFCVRIIKIDTR